MKTPLLIRKSAVLILTISLSFLYACSDDDTNNSDDLMDETTELTLKETDKEALLFMLEEEKLARDTYTYLNDLWSVNQFSNIKNSEQTHMNSVENLLIKNNIEYTILPAGKFKNQMLQNYYNQFAQDGALSKAIAFQIGATIEDLDIKDLQDYLDVTTHPEFIAVFKNLQCGSRNHLRSFVIGVENTGDTYTPQFITQDEYNNIIEGSHEKCN